MIKCRTQFTGVCILGKKSFYPCLQKPDHCLIGVIHCKHDDVYIGIINLKPPGRFVAIKSGHVQIEQKDIRNNHVLYLRNKVFAIIGLNYN